MSETEKNSNIEVNDQNNGNSGTQQALSDERRVKVMSPSMLVFKRFIRNRLAVIGFCILAAMFLFSFVGPIFSPYTESQSFKMDEMRVKDYAEYSVNTAWRFKIAKDAEFPKTASTAAIRFINSGESSYESGGDTYYIKPIGVDADGNPYGVDANGKYEFCVLAAPIRYAQYKERSGSYEIIPDEGNTVSDAMETAIVAAIKAGQPSVIFEEVEYILKSVKDPDRLYTIYSISTVGDVAVGGKMVFQFASADSSAFEDDYEFVRNVFSIYAGATESRSFTYNGKQYTVSAIDQYGYVDISEGSEVFATLTDYSMQARLETEFLTLEYKDAALEAIKNNKTEFVIPGENVDEEGNPVDVKYIIDRQDTKWVIRTEMIARIEDQYAAPSSEHILGTDNYAMDVTTRLMYGGRVSLMVGFIVVAIEMVIGIVLGGIAGYFSGWVDVLIMRVIELFNCIPFYPMLMIIGSVLDANQVSAQARIYLLMAILGILNWTGIARIVRGQILSLREQDFIVATEACGIPVSRRIFKHLIPNVIPLLIVTATMQLGGIIITEATLSYLGLGVKFPLASWGSIINQASSQHVMTNYWWVWLPAGMLILLTVLGFNFVGDGLRDAFDPKMKR